MKSNFDACLAHVLESEGGYVWHPADPGGETNMGISRRAYPEEDIKGMTRERAAYLYRRDYWTPLRCDDLPAGFDLVAFDAGVNSGLSRSAKWLQRALGVEVDGFIGPVTLRAAKAAHRINTINRACAYRMNFLEGLSTWGSFGRGWTRRVAKVRDTALDMAIFVPEQRNMWYKFICDVVRKCLALLAR